MSALRPQRDDGLLRQKQKIKLLSTAQYCESGDAPAKTLQGTFCRIPSHSQLAILLLAQSNKRQAV